jgi:hypothetical protein
MRMAPDCVRVREASMAGDKIVAAQGHEEGDKGAGFGGRKRVAVGGHVAAALQDLTNDLVFGHARGDGVECRTAHAADAAEGVAVAALLVLEHQRALAFERRAAFEIGRRRWIAGPGFHQRAPRSECCQVREDAQRDRDDRDHKYGDRAARPVFFAFAGDERKK